MTHAGLGISTALEPAAAAEEACRVALERLGDHELALALVVGSAAHGIGLVRAAQRASDVLGASCVVGGSVEGIIAADVEVSSYPALMVLALSGIEAQPFLVRDLGGDSDRLGEEIAARQGGDLSADDLVVLMPDSLGLNAARLADGLGEALGPATILGTGAAPTPRGPSLVWLGGKVSTEGAAGFVARAARPRLAIARTGRAVTHLLRVTRARGNWVIGLDGSPALDAYQAAARDLGVDPATDGRPAMLVGIAGRDGSDDLRVRNVVGFDPRRSAFSVPEPMASGDRLAFVQLDADSAREEFVDQLAGLRDPPPAFGMYFNCRARGASLFGEPGVEAKCLANAFSDLPIAGLIGPFQIAPARPGGAPGVLTYAGVLALVDRAR